MVSLTRSKSVIELGTRLVTQLDAHDNFLASWMAHYIAQLIEAYENASEEDKAAAQEACAKTILEFWRHRATLPAHLRPFAELEPVLRTLAALDLNRTDYRYYTQALREAEAAKTDDETKKWLDLAIRIDHAARLLVQFALCSAASRAASTAEPWVELAVQAGADAEVEGRVVNFVLRGDEEAAVAQDARNAILRDRLSKLDAFVSLATSVAEDLRAQLAAAAAETAEATDSAEATHTAETTETAKITATAETTETAKITATAETTDTEDMASAADAGDGGDMVGTPEAPETGDIDDTGDTANTPSAADTPDKE